MSAAEVTLYRVEYPKDRNGPWVSNYGKTAAASYRSRYHRHSPSDGPGWGEERIVPGPSTAERYFTFVRSIDELKWWFRPIHLRQLRSDGFVVGEYVLPQEWVRHGQYQAAGLREMGKHVRDIRLTTILKGKA